MTATATLTTKSGLEVDHARLKSMPLSEIAAIIYSDWRDKNGESVIYFGAKPYLKALAMLTNISDQFGADDGKTAALYFVSNARTWQGPVAKAIKAELNRRIK